MSAPRSTDRLRLFILAALIGLALLVVLASATPWLGTASLGPAEARAKAHAPQGTPVAQPADPLDGDPLDGPPGDKSSDLVQFPITRSGRPEQAGSSLPAYDDDLTTVWQPGDDVQDRWIWFDLGAARRVRRVRWQAEGNGAIQVAISADRQDWEVFDKIPLEQDWQELLLRQDARYVRLTLLPDAQGSLPALAEAAVWGEEDGADASLAQKADKKAARKKQDSRSSRKKKSAKSAQKAGKADDSGSDKESKGNGKVTASAKPGETRCKGDKGKCRAKAGKVRVDDSGCQSSGSCTIDIQADGGSAVCDAQGGDEAEAGDGEGKQGGEGGECEAIADGGTVTIGDINP